MSPTRRQIFASIAGIAATSSLEMTTSASDIGTPDPLVTICGVGRFLVEGAGLHEERWQLWTLDARQGTWEVRLTPPWHDRHAILRGGQNVVVLTPDQAATLQAIFRAPALPERPHLVNVRRHHTSDPDRHAFDLSWFNRPHGRWRLLSADPTIEAAFAPMNCLIRCEEMGTQGGPICIPYHEDVYLAQLPRESLIGFRLTPAQILRGAA